MADGVTVEYKVHFSNGRRGRRRLRQGKEPAPPDVPEGRVPRASKLMALAIHFEKLVADGHVEDYAQIACLGRVTRARITQIMNFRILAPDIQEDILFLPRVLQGRDPITERDLRPIVAELEWDEQRRMWQQIKRRSEADQAP